MIRLILWLALIGGVLWFGSTVQLGKRTLFGHVRAIWHTEEVQDLKEGVKNKAGPAVERIERGVEAGYKAATRSDGSTGSAGTSGSGGSGGSAAITP